LKNKEHDYEQRAMSLDVFLSQITGKILNDTHDIRANVAA
jgi:hypothetical protein